MQWGRPGVILGNPIRFYCAGQSMSNCRIGSPICSESSGRMFHTCKLFRSFDNVLSLSRVTARYSSMAVQSFCLSTGSCSCCLLFSFAVSPSTWPGVPGFLAGLALALLAVLS